MELNRDADVALLRMKAGKANAIGPAFLERLAALLDEAQGARALVITGDKGFFSAGLDLPGLLVLGRSEMKAFIDAFGAGMLRVFDLPMPVVAAVNGHAIAGGCVLALQCDYRIIVEAGCRIDRGRDRKVAVAAVRRAAKGRPTNHEERGSKSLHGASSVWARTRSGQ